MALPEFDIDAQNALVRRIKRKGVESEPVLEAMYSLSREAFIPEEYRGDADPYANQSFSVGHGQTISQPLVVGLMSQRLPIEKGGRVLEIGTGSGYQAAVLRQLGFEVYTIECIEALHDHAKSVFAELGLDKIHQHLGDGALGWPENINGYPPRFNAIIMTCAAPRVPEPVLAQMEEGATVVAPLGKGKQCLAYLHKEGEDLRIERDIGVQFVPLVTNTER